MAKTDQSCQQPCFLEQKTLLQDYSDDTCKNAHQFIRIFLLEFLNIKGEEGKGNVYPICSTGSGSNSIGFEPGWTIKVLVPADAAAFHWHGNPLRPCPSVSCCERWTNAILLIYTQKISYNFIDKYFIIILLINTSLFMNTDDNSRETLIFNCLFISPSCRSCH